MATIVVGAAGTWGDVLPLVALAQGLRDRGHVVRFVVNKAHHPLIRQAGLAPSPCGCCYGIREARHLPKIPNDCSLAIPEFKKAESFLLDTPAQFRDLMNACRGADLLIGHSFQYAAMLVHDELGIPWVCVSVTPGQFEHREPIACTQPAPRATLNLLASSLHFSKPDPESNDHVRVTGFLFVDGSHFRTWQPDATLRSFLRRSGKVLVLSLGCLPGPEADRVAMLCAQVARQLKRRLVIQPGWARINARRLASSHLCVAGPVPHDWLFSRAEAVIHHGGIGRCARALRNGVPMLLLPQRQDQYFNTHAVLSLKAGAALSLDEIEEEGVFRVLAEKVLRPGCRKAAEKIAGRLRKEVGVANACGQVERLLRNQLL